MGLHPAQAAHALRALLRRRGVGDARGVGAALLRQRAGGETQPTSWGGFHDCYLHTDVLALAEWRATGTPSGRSRGSTPSTTSRCPGPPGTPCCGTRPARLPFTSSPTSGRAGLRHGRAELHLPALKPTTPSWARRTTIARSPSADLVLGLQRHVPGRNDAAHAQRPLCGGRPAGR